MTILRHSLPLMPGESLPSYTSRLAAHHGLSAREFCQDFGGRFQDIVDGRREGISLLADLTQTTTADLTAQAMIKTDGFYQFAGERLMKATLIRDKVRICPACIIEDISQSKLEPHVAAYGRAVWLFAPIKTCSKHGMILVHATRSTSPFNTHDFSHLIRPVLPEFRQLEAFPRRCASDLERYLLNRLSGARGSLFLDSLEFHVAAKFCEMLGAISAFGRTPNLKRFSDDEWWKAGAEGYAIASGGAVGIRAFLSEMNRSYGGKRSVGDGPKTIYGRFYEWLAFGAKASCFDPVRDLLRQEILDSMPVISGSTLLGKCVESGRFHTIASAAKVAEMDSRRLFNVLKMAGLISSDSAQPKVLLPIDKFQTFLEKARGAMSLSELREYLNIPPVQADLIIKEGLLTPLDPQAGTSRHAIFSRKDADAFLEKLTQDAVPIDRVERPIANIPMAAKQAHCSAAEVIRLILSRNLSWVGQCAGTHGYLSVLVNVDEIKTQIQTGTLPGYTPSEVERILKTGCRVVKALIENQHLSVSKAKHPISRALQVVVPYEVLENFRNEYVSLFELARERGVHVRVVKRELLSRGFEPAFDPKQVNATFYRRCDIAHCT